MWSAINRLLSEQLGEGDITARQPLSGGEIHPAWQLNYGGRQIFVKWNQREMLDLFTWEAEQLQLLARSNTLRVPAVYGVGSSRDNSFLLLEYIDPQPLTAESAQRLGEQLACLHQWNEQPHFGLDYDNNITTSPQPNSWVRRWSHFFAEQRIGWQLQLAAEKGISYGDNDLIVSCAQCVLACHHPTPVLLHGDLWPANCSVSDGMPWVFDPACYWGDRECDLAMLAWHNELPAQIMEGYQSVWPLPADYTQRQPVYQLYYLLNRANVFGGNWLAEAQKAVVTLLDADVKAGRHAHQA